MKKINVIKAALTAIVLAIVPAMGEVAPVSAPVSVIGQQATPAEQEAVKQLFMDLQRVTSRTTEYSTIGDLRASVAEMAQIQTYGCPSAIRDAFTKLVEVYTQHFALLDKAFKKAGYSDSTPLKDAQTAAENDPQIQESSAKTQQALIEFMMMAMAALPQQKPVPLQCGPGSY